MRRRIEPKGFYDRDVWKTLRYRVISRYGRKCMACGAEGVQIHVDHIKPISIYPELALDESNLQILCAACNMGKSNKLVDDWRPRQVQKVLKRMGEKRTKEHRRSAAYDRLLSWVGKKLKAAQASKDWNSEAVWLAAYQKINLRKREERENRQEGLA